MDFLFLFFSEKFCLALNFHLSFVMFCVIYGVEELYFGRIT